MNKSQYGSRLEWKKDCPKDYRSAYEQGFLPKICELMGWEIPKPKKQKKPDGYWTKELLIIDAKQWDTIKEWKKNNGYGYKVALREGWIDECTSHMKRLKVENGHWNEKDNLIIDAKQWDYPSEWKENNEYAYMTAHKLGFWDECTAHMTNKRQHNPPGHWLIKDNVLSEARKYNTIKEWKKNSSGSYQSALRNDWHAECIKHMK